MAATAFVERDTGSDESFERLYREHAPTVYRYALGTVGNPADAEDIAQATFACALRALRRGQRPEKPENWLISIAHNECRQRFRRLGRRAVEVPLDGELAERASVSDAAETAQEIDGVLGALAELPFNQRAALVLREVSGRSAAEIAESLGTSSAAVEMLIFRARQKLRTDLAGVRALALVPLPRSLWSLMGGPAAKAGGIAAGLGVASKIGAVVVAAVAVGTSGGGGESERPAHVADTRAGRVHAVDLRPPPVARAPVTRAAPRQAPKASRAAAEEREVAARQPATETQQPVVVPTVEVPVVRPPSPAPVSIPPAVARPLEPVVKAVQPLAEVPELPVDVPIPEVEEIQTPAVTVPAPDAPSLP